MKPHILCILDGWGVRQEVQDNGISQAHTPYFDQLWDKSPHTLLQASGPSVGLPEGIMGNSEVGHMNIGAGRIVFSGLSQIYQAIETGRFQTNEALLLAIKTAKDNNSTLHLIGLLSDGAVHSHQDHLYALIDLAKKEGLKKVAIHCILDGRDTSPTSGIEYLQKLKEVIQAKGLGEIASVSGRYYAMDRDQRWDRIQKAFEAFVGTSSSQGTDASEVVNKSYAQNITDEFINPTTICNSDGQAKFPIQKKDAIIFYNFRSDRARQITKAFTLNDFNDFERKNFEGIGQYVCMSPYDESLNLPVAFKPSYPENTLGQVISDHGFRQLRISETEKYAHVTFFFNGGKDFVFKNEERVLIPSAKEVKTYDQKPEMSAKQVVDQLLKKLEQNSFELAVVNFANTDMVGHTAKPQAIIKAVQTVDHCLGLLIKATRQKQAHLWVTADHGNAEQMVDEQGNPHTAHTLNPVPFIYWGNDQIAFKAKTGRLCDIAPTLLKAMNLNQPTVMTGQSLLKN